MTTGVAIFCVVIVVYAAFAAKLDRWSITAPMVFVAAGFVLGTGGTSLLGISPRAFVVTRSAQRDLIVDCLGSLI